MNPKKEREAVLRALCAGERPGDGIDPKEERRDELKRESRERRSKSEWKDAQAACRAYHEIAGELSLVPGLDGVELLRVEAQDAGKTLRAIVAFDGPPEHEHEVLARLGAARGMLRAAVARVVRRKRVPELAFVLVACGAAPRVPREPDERADERAQGEEGSR